MAMKYRKLDSNGDYVFGHNEDDFYHGKAAVGQAIYTSLKLLLGEWFEDTSLGMPLFQHIIGANGSPDNLRGADLLVRDVIIGVQGVKGIKSFSSSFENRVYAVECIVDTVYGDVTISGVTFTP